MRRGGGGTCCLAYQILRSQEELCSLELITYLHIHLVTWWDSVTDCQCPSLCLHRVGDVTVLTSRPGTAVVSLDHYHCSLRSPRLQQTTPTHTSVQAYVIKGDPLYKKLCSSSLPQVLLIHNYTDTWYIISCRYRKDFSVFNRSTQKKSFSRTVLEGRGLTPNEMCLYVFLANL
jgi:hypothetical protein